MPVRARAHTIWMCRFYRPTLPKATPTIVVVCLGAPDLRCRVPSALFAHRCPESHVLTARDAWSIQSNIAILRLRAEKGVQVPCVVYHPVCSRKHAPTSISHHNRVLEVAHAIVTLEVFSYLHEPALLPVQTELRNMVHQNQDVKYQGSRELLTVQCVLCVFSGQLPTVSAREVFKNCY